MLVGGTAPGTVFLKVFSYPINETGSSYMSHAVPIVIEFASPSLDFNTFDGQLALLQHMLFLEKIVSSSYIIL